LVHAKIREKKSKKNENKLVDGKVIATSKKKKISSEL
jgi:hypothetical protein